VPENKGQMQFSVAKSSSERWDSSTVMSGPPAMGGDKNTALFDATQFMSQRKDSTTWDNLADFVSMDSDGFTINQTTAGMNDADVLVIGIKFAGKGDSHVGFFNTVTTAPTVDQAVTGVGFKPRTLITANCNEAEGIDNVDVEYSIGMTDGTRNSARGVFVTAGESDRDVRYLDDKFIEMSQVNGASPPTTLKEGELKSMDLDGFTVTWTVNNAVAEAVGFIAIGGGERPHWQGPRPQPFF
jgi:hypothetical protein